MTTTSDPFLRFTNERSFIQVRNIVTGVAVFLNKTPLLIQRDSDFSFVLKNDTYVGYYKYADVLSPESEDIDELLNIILQWVDTQSFRDNELDREADRIIDVRTNLPNSTTKLLESVIAGAVSTYDPTQRRVEMRLSSTDADSRLVRQTREYVPVTFIAKTAVVMEATLRSRATDVNDVMSRVGIFEDVIDLTVPNTGPRTGFFFEAEHIAVEPYAVMRAVYRHQGEAPDERVVMTDWNVDPLNGTGGSGFTLDPTVPQLWVFNWDPVTRLMRMGVAVQDNVYYAHEFGRVGPRIDTPNAPVRWEIEHTGGTAPTESGVMFQGSASVFSMETSIISMVSIDVGLTRKTNNDFEAVVPLLSFRLKQNCNRARLSARKLVVMNTTSSGVGKWELVLNPDTLDEATYEPLQDSFSEFSNTETATSGGKVVATGFVFDAGVSVIDLKDKNIFASSSIAGVPDVVSLRLINISGVLDVLSGVEWDERG